MKEWTKKHKKMVITIAALLVVGLAAAIVLSKFKSSNNAEATKQKKENVVTLSKMNLTSSISATGTLESANSKVVSADLSNVTVKSVKVKEGDQVKKGQTLVTFDESDLKETYTEAKESLTDTKTQNANALASANRKLADAKETYASDKKKMKKAVAEAKTNYAVAKKAVAEAKTAQDKEKAKTALTQAKNNYEQAKEEQEKSNKQNKESIQNAKDNLTTTKSSNKRNLKEAERSVDDAEEALDNCSITASISGTVTAVGVEEGEICNGGDLFEISDCTNLQVSTTVSEYDIAKVKKGQKVVILTDSTGDTELQGEISYVALTTGSSLSSSSSGTSQGGNSMSSGGSSSSSSSSGYEVQIQMKDTNENLRVGMTAKCSIILEEVEDVFAVPYDAIHTNNSGDSVLYVKDSSGKKEVTVTKGMESDYYVEVSGDDLEENMQVMIPTDSTSKSSSTTEKSDSSLSSMFGGSGRGNRSDGGMGGMGGPGGAPGM